MQFPSSLLPSALYIILKCLLVFFVKVRVEISKVIDTPPTSLFSTFSPKSPEKDPKQKVKPPRALPQPWTHMGQTAS